MLATNASAVLGGVEAAVGPSSSCFSGKDVVMCEEGEPFCVRRRSLELELGLLLEGEERGDDCGDEEEVLRGPIESLLLSIEDDALVAERRVPELTRNLGIIAFLATSSFSVSPVNSLL